MKFTLALLVIAAFIGCALSSSCTDADWYRYKASWNKHYLDPSEDQRHHDIYCENVKLIDEHNLRYLRGEETWQRGINSFTDLSKEDMAIHHGLKP